MKKVFALLVPITIGMLFTASVFLPQEVNAQSPEKMSYQAVIRNSSDQLVTNQQIGMQISILQDIETGTAVYVEKQTPTTNANGLVSIEIGGDDATILTGDFTTIDWSAGSYFIKTETDPTGGIEYTITGTSQLLSVPYALHAKTSGTADYNSLTNNPDIIDSISTVIDTTTQFLRPEADASVSNLEVNGSTRLGSNGVSFFEIREITGTTSSTGTITMVILPTGCNMNNTRVLSVEVFFGGQVWAGQGHAFMQNKLLSYQMGNRVLYLLYSNVSEIHSKAYRIVIMRVN